MTDAVWHARRLTLDYESWRGAAQRELEPLGLVLKAGAWYVLARSVGSESVRTYRLASILALKAIGGSFKRPRGFDLTRSWQASAARFEADLHKLQAASARARLAARPEVALQRARPRRRTARGGLRAERAGGLA